MALVSKLHAEIRLTINDKADTGTLSFDVDSPTKLESLDEIPDALADAVRKRLALLGKAEAKAPEAQSVPVVVNAGPVVTAKEAGEAVAAALKQPDPPAPSEPKRKGRRGE